ncbi:MAG: 5'-nucleotidase C-terminal domain-containing protein [Firmicutes bacterium]|nr:5'-nucleotidase C-terminal domain-containing protein [Bacillota bacterium]MDH7494517.1 5'-nucleotidase C-terminal domain-containing protein [Bacillota bacterium]
MASLSLRSKRIAGVGVLVFLLSVVCVLPAAAAPASGHIVILYTNDVHGRLEAFKPSGSNEAIGGMIKLATLVEDIVAKEGENVLILNAGDSIHGTNIVNLFEGKSMIEVMEAVGVQAMAVGNHEFNYGQPVLLERANEADFPFLSANTIRVIDGRAILPGVLIVTVDGIRVGILGLSPLDTYTSTHPKNVVGLEFVDPIRVAGWMVPFLREQEGVDIVIALSHIGYEEDKKLASAVPGIDVIVGGHSHTRLEKPEKVGGTIIVSAGEHARDLGKLEITVENGIVTAFSGGLVPVAAGVAEDNEVKAIVAGYQKQLEERLSAVVGESMVTLDGERAHVRTRETNLGNLVADVMRAAGQADIALTNGGGIRASMDKGPITVGEIFTVLPFDNTLVVLEVSGENVKKALERAVSDYPKELGAFLQVSGVRFEFDPAKPAGGRVMSVEIAGAPLDPKKLYKVATNDFMAAGGDGYDMFKGAKVLFSSGEMLRDVMARYIAEAGAVSPQVEARIVVK